MTEEEGKRILWLHQLDDTVETKRSQGEGLVDEVGRIRARAEGEGRTDGTRKERTEYTWTADFTTQILFLQERLLQDFPDRPKHLLLFINPGCGNNNGMNMMNKNNRKDLPFEGRILISILRDS